MPAHPEGRLFATSLFFLLFTGPLLVHAGVVTTDGTIGPARTLTGPNFTVSPALGQTRGGNLFHSFTTFDLSAGESATFTGPIAIHNVFARVTGGQPSSIDGTIRCTIPNATFYLINPSGVVFGPDAALDVKGSFAVTTAGTIRLGTSGSFNAVVPGSSMLTTAAPAAFGFLSAHAGGIAIQGAAGGNPAVLAVPRGKVLSVIGGPVQIVNGQLIASAGRVNMAAVGSMGEVELDASNLDAQTQTVTSAVLADVGLAAQSRINLNGVGGGRFSIVARNFTLDASAVSSTTQGAATGLPSDVDVSLLELTHGASFTSDVTGSGAGGPIDVRAHSIVVNSQGRRPSQFGTIVEPHATGPAGDVDLHSKALSVLAGGEIGTSTLGRGDAGDLHIQASSLLMDGSGSSAPTAIASQSSAAAAGRAGTVSIDAGTMQVQSGAQVSDSTFGAGPAGDLGIVSSSLTVDGRGSRGVTLITTQANPGATAPAGDFTLHVGTLRLVAGGQLDAATLSSSKGGDVSVAANDVTIDARGNLNPANFTGIFSTSTNTKSNAGAAGDVTLSARKLSILAGGNISADTSGSGRGGNVFLSARNLVVDGKTASAPTGVFASSTSTEPGAGAAGNVTVQAGDLTLLSGGQLGSNTDGSGTGGNLSVTANSLVLNGSHSTAFTAIAADTQTTGAAGDLTIQADSVRVLGGALISIESFGTGAGGVLSLSASDLTINGRGAVDASHISGIFADARGTSARAGAAGGLSVHTRSARLLAGGEIRADTFGSGKGGGLNLVATSKLTIDDRGNGFEDNPSGIFADTNGTARGSGAAGNLTIRAGVINIRAGGSISATSFGAGKGGNLDLTATSSLYIDDRGNQDEDNTTGIFADANTSSGLAGDAGSLAVHAGAISILAGGTISASTFGSGKGGNLSLAASSLTVNDRGNEDEQNITGIFADTESPDRGAGAAGALTLQVGTIRVLAGATITAGSLGPGNGGNLAITTSNLTADDRGNADENNLTGVFADTTAANGGAGGAAVIRARNVHVLGGAEISTATHGSGVGGSLTLVASRLTIDGSNSHSSDLTGIFSNTNSTSRGAGAAGNLTLRAGIVDVLADGQIAANTFGTGSSGTLSLTSTSLTIDGTGGTGETGLFASSVSTARGAGNAGNLDLQTDSLRVVSGGQIGANTNGPGNGGDMEISATSVVTDGGKSNQVTLIAAEANPGSSGSAGNLTIHAGSIQVLAGAAISADTSGSGRGGRLTITANRLVVDDRHNIASNVRESSVSAATDSSASNAGPAGDLTISANVIRVIAGGDISASTLGAGRGGNLTIDANTVKVDGKKTFEFAGIFASSGFGSGAAGNLTLSAGEVSLLSGGQLGANTRGTGSGGNLSVNAGSLTLDDTGDSATGGFTGIAAESGSSSANAGAAGNITIQAGPVRVLGGAEITASTIGPGKGGSVVLNAAQLLVDGSRGPGRFSAILAKSTGTGAAGSVQVSSHGPITASGGAAIGASATHSAAGDVSVSSDDQIFLDGGSVSAQANQAGGNVIIDTPLFVQMVHHASVITESGAANGGNITIDALVLSVKHSSINANGGINGGNIAVSVDATPGVISTGPIALRNLTATGATGVSGSIQTGPATSDIAHSLARLPAELQSSALTLQPQCSQTTDNSTFLLQGRGSIADEPGTWDVDFGFDPVPPADRKER